MAISDLLKGAREAESADDTGAALDTPSDELPEDPPPARRRARSAGARSSGPAARVSAAQRRAVHDALEMMIVLPAGIAELRDPICGGALAQQADAIVERLTPIVCRNPVMLSWFTESAGYMDWIGLVTALWPVARTVWSHHVTHSIGGEGDGDGDGAGEDFSQYTAPAFAAA